MGNNIFRNVGRKAEIIYDAPENTTAEDTRKAAKKKAKIVNLIVFDGGDGNLCVECHRSRDDFTVEIADVDFVDRDGDGVTLGPSASISSRFGLHHGPQGDYLKGTNNYDSGTVAATGDSPHMIGNTCVTCHHYQPTSRLSGNLSSWPNLLRPTGIQLRLSPGSDPAGAPLYRTVRRCRHHCGTIWFVHGHGSARISSSVRPRSSSSYPSGSSSCKNIRFGHFSGERAGSNRTGSALPW